MARDVWTDVPRCIVPVPHMMRAETAALFCNEPSVDDFLAKVGITYPEGREIRPGELRWFPDDLQEAKYQAQERIRGYIYFVRSGAFVKIGFAKDVERRLRELQCSNPHPLVLLHAIPVRPHTEAGFHRRFAVLRTSGEWFRLEGDLLDFLRSEGCDV